MSTQTAPHFKFVWRTLAAPHDWHTFTTQAVNPKTAFAALCEHIEAMHELPLEFAVVDHEFFTHTSVDAAGELDMQTCRLLSLRDYLQPFHYQYGSLVYAPDADEWDTLVAHVQQATAAQPAFA